MNLLPVFDMGSKLKMWLLTTHFLFNKCQISGKIHKLHFNNLFPKRGLRLRKKTISPPKTFANRSKLFIGSFTKRVDFSKENHLKKPVLDFLRNWTCIQSIEDKGKHIFGQQKHFHPEDGVVTSYSYPIRDDE